MSRTPMPTATDHPARPGRAHALRQLLDAAFLAANGARLNQVAVGLLVLFAFQAVINFGQSYLMAGVSERVIADLRKDLFGHLALQPPGFFSMRRVGELSSRLAADPAMIQQVLRFGVPELMRQGLFLITRTIRATPRCVNGKSRTCWRL